MYLKTKGDLEEMSKLEQYWVKKKKKIKIRYKRKYTIPYLCCSTFKSIFKYSKVSKFGHIFFINYTSSEIEIIC